MRNVHLNFLVAAIALLATDVANADPVPVLANGTYQLDNHPDGGARPPLYGLRLDGLNGINSSIFTFDFMDDAGDSADDGAGMLMSLDLDNSTIQISGTVFGGKNAGSGYAGDEVGLWDIDFTYGANIQVDGSGRIFIAPEDNVNNNGTITPQFSSGTFSSGTSIGLWDYITGGNGTVFNLDTNHRGFAGVSGWGWLNHTDPDDPHISASDWLFTVNPEPIPAPGAALMGLIGLGIVGARRRHVG